MYNINKQCSTGLKTAAGWRSLLKNGQVGFGSWLGGLGLEFVVWVRGLDVGGWGLGLVLGLTQFAAN